MREPVDVKALRYLTEGRLTVEHVLDDVIGATCHGGGRVYRCSYSSQSGWCCDCPARGKCSHLIALQLVTSATPSALAPSATNEGGS